MTDLTSPQRALIVAHGQPSDTGPAEDKLALLAQSVASHLPGWEVQSATLAARKRFQQVARNIPTDTRIFPLFMAEGWFVKSELPKRLGDVQAEILPAFGINPRLPDLAADAISDAARVENWSLDQVDLVLAAHGSGRSRNPAQVTHAFADALRQRLPQITVHTGFVEEPPSIEQQARKAGPKALCLPFFAASGGHALDDVPDGLATAGFAGRLMPVLGELPAVPDLIAEAIRQGTKS